MDSEACFHCFFGIKGRFAGELFVTIKKLVGSGKPEVSPVGNCGARAPAYPLPACCGSSALGIVLLFSQGGFGFCHGIRLFSCGWKLLSVLSLPFSKMVFIPSGVI